MCGRTTMSLWMLGLVLAACEARGAETWAYVSNMIGNDSTGDGTREKPLATVDEALMRVESRIRLLPNATGTPYPIIRTDQFQDLDYVIEAEDGPLTTRLVGFVSSGSRNYTIAGFTISNPNGYGVVTGASDAALIRNCVIAYCARDGVFATAKSTTTIENSVLYGNGENGLFVQNYTNRYEPVFVSSNNTVFSNNGIYGIDIAETGDNDNVVQMSYCAAAGNKAGAQLDPARKSLHIVNTNEITAAHSFVSFDTCDFRLASGFHIGSPGIRNPDGSRSDPGAFGGPGAARWFVRGPDTRPTVSSVSVDKTVDPSGKLKVKVTVKVQD